MNNVRTKKVLRSGYTTGACATACAYAAAYALFSGEKPHTVNISLPAGQSVLFEVVYAKAINNRMRCHTIKDAGDDPDVTHGAEIGVTIELLETQQGFVFHAGKGVGIVTKPGLPCAVGEAAINPVPKKMIRQHLQQLAQQFNYDQGFKVTIDVVNGEDLAKKTLNSRLGIVGGLSILGTTGIVKPFSCSAYIASIQQAIDVAQANGQTHLVACTGSTSERAAQATLALPEVNYIEVGDFIGAFLKYKNLNAKELTIAGGLGKCIKLAQGHLNLHSQYSRIDFRQLAQIFVELGASDELQQKIIQSNTSEEAYTHAQQAGIDLAEPVAKTIQNHLHQRFSKFDTIEIIIVNRAGEIIARV
ncbi:MAG: cobalt-precorrin-5B (C(1))-methyltransferase [Gammaproteobacteria bacterium]|nr:cobalt-precorrin-5B (C(1))-methyltransferase [Gammaproteobacteria bacterium]